MANPQTWTDPSTGDTYELIPDTPVAAAPKTWTDPSTGDTYELIPDTPVAAIKPRPKNNLMAATTETVASIAKKPRPDVSGALQSLWDSGVRNPEMFNTVLNQKFSEYKGPRMSATDIAALRRRDATYKAQKLKNPGNFSVTEETGLKDPEAPTNIVSSALTGMARSAENMSNTVTGLGALGADLVGANETSDYLLNKYIEDQAKIDFNNPSAIERASDIDSVGSALMYGSDVLGGLVPDMLSSVGTGGLGAIAGKKAVGKFVENAAEEQLMKGAARGAIAGTAASTVGQETGAIFGDTYRDTNVKAPVSSIVAGIAAGSLDAIVPLKALNRLGVPSSTFAEALMKRAGKAAVKDMSVEGLTEAAQTFIEGLPEAVVTGKSPFTAEMFDNMVESAIQGGIGGAVMGGGSEYLRRETPAEATSEAVETPVEETPVAPVVEETIKRKKKEPTVNWDQNSREKVKKAVKEGKTPYEIFIKFPELSKTVEARKAIEWYFSNSKPGRAKASKPVKTATPEAAPAAAVAVNKQQAVDHINGVIASDWKNAPEITVVESLDELPDDVRQNIIDDGAQDAKGVTIDGKVYVLSQNLKDLDDLAGVTYHEALGHVGLGMQFGKRLNAVLEQMYNSNAMIREAADGWLDKNSTQSENPIAHAVEEILAETSEGGAVDVKVMDKIRAFIKQYARRVPGLKNLKYTDKEVLAILSMANNKVISGKGSAVSGNGNRYMYIGSRGVSERAEYTSEIEDKYYDAVDLAEQGYDASPGGTVHQETGWFFGPDRRWRTEISDEGAKFKEGINGADLDKSKTKKMTQETLEQFLKSQQSKAASYEQKMLFKKTLTILPKYFEKITNTLPTSAYDIWRNPPAGVKGLVENITSIIEKSGLKNDLISSNKLGDIIDHPEFFNIYPEAKNVTVQHLNEFQGLLGYKGFFRDKDNIIGLSREADNLSTVLHEIQHWVQNYEGFAKGGNPESALYAFDTPKLKNLYAKVAKYNNKLISRLATEYAAIESLLSNDNVLEIFALQKQKDTADFATKESVAISEKIKKAYEKFYKDFGLTRTEARNKFTNEKNKVEWLIRRGDEEIEKRLDEIAKEIIQLAETNSKLKNAMEKNSKTELVKALSKNKTLSFQAYEHLFGEVEARDVQARQNMNNAQRSRVTPYTSEDHIEPNDYVITFGGNESQNRYSKPEEGDRPRGLRTDKIVGKKKSFYEPFLKQLEADMQPREVQTWEETASLAEDIGINVAKVMKLNRGPTAEEFTASVNFLVGRMNLIGDLSTKDFNGTITDRDRDKLAIYLQQFADMYDVLAETKTNVARTLNIMNRIVENEKSAANTLRYMLSNESQSLLDDPKKIKQLAAKIHELKGLPVAQKAKATKMLLDPRFEDHFQSLWFNSVLSNPITHKINILGSVGNFMMDLAEHGFAAVAGQSRRNDANADRVAAKELLWRFYGAAMGMKGAFAKATEAFKVGEPVTKIGALERSHSSAKTVLGVVMETPSRALAAEDEFMRNIIMSSSYYGMAMRTAVREGLKGDAAFKRANELVVNPTDEMVLTAADYTRALQFVDKPSSAARAYLSFVSRKPNDGVAERSLKFLGSLFTPFIPTADSIFRTAVRRSPFGGMDRYNQADKKAGGARKDVATARKVMGSMLAMWVANAVVNGTISGDGPEDYDKKEALMASGWRPNSIKVGDKWYSYEGLDPMALNLSLVANMIEDYKERKVDDKGFADQATAAVGSFTRSMVNATWIKSLAFMTEGVTNARSGGQAVENLLLNSGTGFVPFSGMGRFMGSIEDPVERDVSSDGSMSGRFNDRVKSVVPFLKSSLPARHDVYGREKTTEPREGLGWLGRKAQSTIDTDPTVIEIQRLSDATGKVVVGMPDKNDAKKHGVERMDSAQYQAYLDHSGDLIFAATAEAIKDPEYQELTDQERFDLIKVISKDMRLVARNELFGEIPEEEEELEPVEDGVE